MDNHDNGQPQERSKKPTFPKIVNPAAAATAAEHGPAPPSPQLYRNNAEVGDDVGPGESRRHRPSLYGERRILRHRPLVSLASQADIGGSEFNTQSSLGFGLEPCYSIALETSPNHSEPRSSQDMFVNPIKSPRRQAPAPPDNFKDIGEMPDREEAMDGMDGGNTESNYGSSPRYIMTPKSGFDLKNAFSLHNASSVDSIDDIFGVHGRSNPDGVQEFWLKFFYGLLAGMIFNFLAVFPVFWMERTEKRRTGYLIGLSIGSLLQVAVIGSWIVYRRK